MLTDAMLRDENGISGGPFAISEQTVPKCEVDKFLEPLHSMLVGPSYFDLSYFAHMPINALFEFY